MIPLSVPITEKEVRSLRAGDIVSLTGTVYTMRDEAHLRALESRDVPFSLHDGALYHCGPIMQKRDGKWNLVAAGPTTSSRMSPLTPKLLSKYDVRAIIGKGGMSDEVVASMAEHGCVYLAFTGGAAVLAARHVRSVDNVFWYDLGMPEAVWVLDVLEFGPLVVAIDTKGHSLYDDVKKQLDKKLPSIKNTLGI